MWYALLFFLNHEFFFSLLQESFSYCTVKMFATKKIENQLNLIFSDYSSRRHPDDLGVLGSGRWPDCRRRSPLLRSGEIWRKNHRKKQLKTFQFADREKFVWI